MKNHLAFVVTPFLAAACLAGCGERLGKWQDTIQAGHDDFQKKVVQWIGEAKVLKAELDRRISDLQKLEKDLTKLDAEASVRLDLLPKQFGEVEKEIAATQRSRERLAGLLAEGGESVTVGQKTYSRSAAEQMQVSLETEEEKLNDRLKALGRKKERIAKSKPVLREKRDSVRKTLVRVKAAREKLEEEISESALADRIAKAVGDGEESAAQAENRIKSNVEELTVKVRSEIVVSDDVINAASSAQEVNDLRQALLN